jgi:hypothetical protein
MWDFVLAFLTGDKFKIPNFVISNFGNVYRTCIWACSIVQRREETQEAGPTYQWDTYTYTPI